MKSDKVELKFWGVRGSIPVSGPEFERYGGNTSCIELSCGGRHLLFDAGTGVREASEALRAAEVHDIDLFFTHSHYDHIIGLPFFEPIYKPNVSVNMWSGHLAGKTTTRDMIDEFMRPPWFPVKPDICRATLGFRDFTPGDTLEPHPGIVIHTASLVHPGGSVGYRIEWAGRTIALIYDTEHRDGEVNETALDLMRGRRPGHLRYDLYRSRNGKVPRFRPFDLAGRRQGSPSSPASRGWRCFTIPLRAPMTSWTRCRRRRGKACPAPLRPSTARPSSSSREDRQGHASARPASLTFRRTAWP